LSLKGHWVPSLDTQEKNPWSQDKLQTAVYVPLIHGKARLAFYLIDPRSPDGLVYWRMMNSVDILAIAPKNGQSLSILLPESHSNGQK